MGSRVTASNAGRVTRECAGGASFCTAYGRLMVHYHFREEKESGEELRKYVTVFVLCLSCVTCCFLCKKRNGKEFSD